jgi:periplasmic protein CpxP/Spy
MKKVLTSLLIAFLAVGSCYAQPGGYDPAARLQKEIDGLTTALNLTKDQVEKVTPIVAAGQKKQSELFAKMRDAGGDMDRDKMHDEMNKLQAETDKELKAVLTPEQGTKLDAYRKQQAEERAKRMQQMK